MSDDVVEQGGTRGRLAPGFWHDKAWLSEVLGVEVIDVREPKDLVGAGGYVSAMTRFEVNSDGPRRISIIVKRLTPEQHAQSAALGLAREAYFFNELAPHLGLTALPRVYYAYGDMATGEKELLMQDLSDCAQCGYLFGPGSPHNWGKDMAALAAPAAGLTAEEATRLAFREAAKLHARHWGKAGDMSAYRHWLRGAMWLTGEGREAWVAAQDTVVNAWTPLRAHLFGDDSEDADAEGVIEHGGVRWARWFARVVDASISRVSWEDFQKALQRSRTLTLVHGDFHPANAMVRVRAADDGSAALDRTDFFLLDWENVGIGSGPQDLSQWVISHMDPGARRACERDLVQEYYRVLREELEGGGTATADLPAFADVWAEYVAGGVERWMWLLVLLTTMVPAPALQYFHDQVAAFCKDHGVDQANVGQPRV